MVNDYNEFVNLLFASMAIMYSFKLPSAIIELQKDGIDHGIEEHRKVAGIKD